MTKYEISRPVSSPAGKGRLDFKIKSRGWTVLTAIVTLGLLSFLAVTPSTSQPVLGVFEGHCDVGSVKIAGSAVYNMHKQEYVIEGSGANMWSDRDEFHLLWKRMSGNFILQATAEFLGSGANEHRKMGWIVRTSLDSNSAYADIAVHGDGLTSLQYRRIQGGPTEEIRSSISKPNIIQLERKGTSYTMSGARYGDILTADTISDLMLGDTVYVGLYVCSHDDRVSEKSVFSNVRIIIPARDGFIPYQDYIGSNLEILDIETGIRKIIYLSNQSLQAPNWTPDGKALIYNSNGLLYRFDLDEKIPVPEVINTDFANQNNNDHVMSYDGSMIGISHHDKDNNNQSTIYILPAQGGIPRQMTFAGPSYLHDWSPDGRFLTYTAERNGEYDIYKIPVQGGKEIRLTSTMGLDDGSQYTPDGEFIYFNSVRSGTMEIWRMKPDGSAQEQITRDPFNNWFPHVSPDGKWIVFLSYLPDVNPGDHPFYRQVYIRLLPITGGIPKVIAYVYGGQGTINVSSWSPDSKKVAFVSNTDVD